MSWQQDEIDELRLENLRLRTRIKQLEKQVEQQNEDRLKLARSC